MLSWISENIATIVLCAALIAVVAAIVANLIKNQKKGKTSCGCGCANCAMSNSCHAKK